MVWRNVLGKDCLIGFHSWCWSFFCAEGTSVWWLFFFLVLIDVMHPGNCILISQILENAKTQTIKEEYCLFECNCILLI